MTEQHPPRSLTTTRVLGALALLAGGAVHYQQYRYAYYSTVPTIGSLFLLDIIAAGGLGILLLAPLGAALGRVRDLLRTAAALAGIAVAGGGLVALVISEHTPLFGFMEHGYRPAIVLAIASDVVAVTMLAAFLATRRWRALRRRGPQRLLDLGQC
jgi:hypothetical protein